MRFGRPVPGLAALAVAALTLAHATLGTAQPGRPPADVSSAAGALDPSTRSAVAMTATLAKGKALFETRCNECHAYQDAAQMRNSRETWALVLDRMSSNGLEATADERALILDYLAITYPADRP